MLVDVPLSLFGDHAPWLWLVVARTGALLAIALAFRLAWRLAGPLAGLVAAGGLAVTTEYLGYLFLAGMSEPWAAAAVLAAVDDHLLGRRRRCVAWLAVASLVRLEAWPLFVLYVVWTTWRRRLVTRAVSVVLAIGLCASWFVIDWFGSGHLLRSASAASQQSQGGPLLTREPGLAVIREFWHLLPLPLAVLGALGLVAAALTWRQPRSRTLLTIGVAGIAWWLVAAVMAQGRFATGASRYLLPVAALATVLAGVFVSDVVARLLALAGSRPHLVVRAVLATAAAVAVGAVCVPRLVQVSSQVREGSTQAQQSLRLLDRLPAAVTLAGGRDGVLRCGEVVTAPLQNPLLAWRLDVAPGRVDDEATGSGTVFAQSGLARLPAALAADYRTAGSVGPVGQPGARWTVLVASCAAR